MQNEYSLLHREPEREVLAECERQGLAFLPYFPLASGLLTGKYRKGQALPRGTRISDNQQLFGAHLSEQNLALVEELNALAERRGHSILELAIAWLLARSVVASVIAGATSAEQVRANARAAEWMLSPAEVQEVERILGQGR